MTSFHVEKMFKIFQTDELTAIDRHQPRPNTGAARVLS